MKQNNAPLVFATLTLVAFAASVACKPASDSRRADALPPYPVGSSGDVATQTVDPQPRRSFATTLSVYPTELAFGDVAYLTLTVKNVSNATRSLPGFYDDRDARLLTGFERISVTADGIPSEYVVAPEFATPLYRDAQCLAV